MTKPVTNQPSIEAEALHYLRLTDMQYGSRQEGGMPYVRRVLEHGRLWQSAPPEAQPKRMIRRQCFQNCWRSARAAGPVYCEGWAVPQGVGLAMLHAWLLDDQGRVLEPTWATPGLAYIGVPVQYHWHLKTVIEARAHCLAGEGNRFIPAEADAWVHPIVALGQPLNSSEV